MTQRIVLSNYRVPALKKGARIGELHLLGATTPATGFTLVHNPGNLFEIRGNQLKLAQDTGFPAGASSYFVDVTIGASLGSEMLSVEFRLVRDDFLTNRVVAHRGAHKHGPGAPNSMTAFKGAVEMGCAAFECDVLLTADNKIVTAHGPGSGHDGGVPDIPVHLSSLADLSRVDLGNGDGIPGLHEVLEMVMKQNRTGLVVELKKTRGGKDLELVRQVFKLVNRMKAWAWVSFISFSYPQLLEILKHHPFSFCSPIIHYHTDVALYAEDGMRGVDFRKDLYSRKLVEKCHAAGLIVNSWTVNKPALIKKFLQWEFDLITTDEPGLCLSLVSEFLKDLDVEA